MALYVVSMMMLIVGAAALPAQEMLPDSAGVMHPVATTNTGGPDATVDSNCFSISAGASDFWCQTSCGTANPAACPTTVCQCGEKALPVVKQPLAAQAAQETQAAAPARQARARRAGRAGRLGGGQRGGCGRSRSGGGGPTGSGCADRGGAGALTAANEAAAAAAAEATNPWETRVATRWL